MKILLVLLITSGCTASGFNRSFEYRTYRPCKAHESKTPGVFCYRKCVKYKVFRKHASRNCRYWKYDRIDISDPETFKKVRAAGMILKKEY